MVAGVNEMVLERASWRGHALGAAVLVLPMWLWAWWQLVFLPEDVLVTNVLVDDALYFALPARHWWEGHGFSFDGVELTNGVQTLWALVCIALAGVFSEPLSMLRAMVGLSALCWLLAGGGLFVLLRRRSLLAGMLAAVGFAWAGVHDRVAFQGMENGLHALVGVLVLLAGARAIGRAWSRGATLQLGVALALFGLSRTEGVLLGPIVAAPMVFGWLGAPGGPGRRLGTALWMALPGVVLVGGACALSRLWFDSFLPISGSVKQFYEASWGAYDDPGHHAAGRGGPWRMAAWHLQFATRLSIAPLREHVPALLADVTPLGHRPFRNAIWVLLAVGLVAAVVRIARGARRREPGERAVPPLAVVWCFVAYAVVHVVLVGLTLSHFTSYAKWYFASETTAVWLVLALLVPASSRWGWRACIVAAGLLSLAGALDGGNVTHDVRTNQFKRAGQWLQEHTPPGTVVGALSSGLVGWYASDQHVVNLDGLINNRRYLDDFLKRDRFGDYFADRGITWFADYQPIAGWQHGISWRGNVPAARLVPRRYWRMPDEHAYVIWQILPEGSTFALLGDEGPEVRDRYAELAVAADVHGRFPVVADADLAAALAEQPPRYVARSLGDGGGNRWHVLATAAQLDRIALRADRVQPERGERVPAAAGVDALGYDLRDFRRKEQRYLTVTVFWLRTDGALADAPELRVAVGGESKAVALGSTLGARPLDRCAVGTVVPETFVLAFEGDEPPRVGVGRPDDVRWFTR